MDGVDNAKLDRRLIQVSEVANPRCKERGFQRRVGSRKKPTLVSDDLANARTRQGNPFICEQKMMGSQIVPGLQRLLAACRANGHPVIHVTTAHEITDRNADFTDRNLWQIKIPVDVVDIHDKEIWAIDSRIAPVKGEFALLEKRARSFPGAEPGGIPRANSADTIRVTGMTACACVHQTICDGNADSVRTVAVKEAIGKQAPGTVTWNLSDTETEFGDVETVDTWVAYVSGVVEGRARTER